MCCVAFLMISEIHKWLYPDGTRSVFMVPQDLVPFTIQIQELSYRIKAGVRRGRMQARKFMGFSSWHKTHEAEHTQTRVLKSIPFFIFFFWALFIKMTNLKMCWIYDYLLSKLLNLYTSTTFNCLLVYCGSVLNWAGRRDTGLLAKGNQTLKAFTKWWLVSACRLAGIF